MVIIKRLSILERLKGASTFGLSVNYTIGQRKGIKIASNNPLYVVNIDADKNTIIVGEKEYLEIKNMNKI